MSIPTGVIFNPAAGRGRAGRIRDDWQPRCPAGTRFFPTEGPGHATSLAQEAVRLGCERIVAAGGDGTVHEVACGLLEVPHDSVRLGVIPVGSMNDYAFSLGVLDWWREQRSWDELQTRRVDIGRVTMPHKSRHFINGLGIGFNGYVTIEARQIRWLRGVPLYSLALLKALIKQFASPRLQIDIDGKNLDLPTLAFSIALGQREGGFPLTPLAKIDDHLFELLHVGDIARWELIRYFPGMLTGNLPVDHPKLQFDRCRSVRVQSVVPLCVHADGEVIVEPQDGVRELQVELLPGELQVETYEPSLHGGKRFEAVRQRREAAGSKQEG